MADTGLVEINEAFAAQVLACLEAMDWHEYDALNVNRFGIALRHPIDATGGRIVTALLHEMERRDVHCALRRCVSAAARAW